VTIFNRQKQKSGPNKPLLRQNQGEQGRGKLLLVSVRAEAFSSGDLTALPSPQRLQLVRAVGA
jgi:hypothetical protein